MGKDTCVRLKGHVTQQQIIEFLNSIGYLADDKTNIYPLTFDVNDNRLYSNATSICCNHEESGFIRICKNEESSVIFYLYPVQTLTEDVMSTYVNYPDRPDLLIMESSDTTFLDMRYSEDNLDLMKTICEHFGGWIDENDCDDETYRFIGKE